MKNNANNRIFETLEQRGYVYQCTNLDSVKKNLSQDEPVVFYLGIDPTADSLHIGHFFALMMFRYLQDAGHKGILVIGGATALIGDPSGKSDMRKMLTKEQVEYNLEEVRTLAKKFIKTDGSNPAIILNNADWLNPYSYVDFMRDVGIHFNVNRMLAADAYSKRLESGGLTFLEMGYMLMQAYDFIFLKKEYNCTLQIGGSDQWGNIVAGTTLNRKLNFIDETIKVSDNDIFGLTCPLLLTKDGKKMGKTETGTLWVAREKTTPYDFYQYFYNVSDTDVDTLLRLFTHVSLPEIQTIVSTDIIKAKKLMAYKITSLVHGEDEANKVIVAVESLFGANNDFNNVPKSVVNANDLNKGIPILDFLVQVGFVASKSEGRRLIIQNGISLNGNKVDSLDATINHSNLNDGFIMLKKGKKNFMKIVVE